MTPEVAANPESSLKIRLSDHALGAEALQRAIFNSANFSKIATDAKGVIQIFNVGAQRMLGYTAEEVVDKITPAEISDPQEIIARAAALSAELETPIAPGFEALVFKASRGIEDIYELTYIRKDGSRFPAAVSVTALRDAADSIIGYLLIGTDNTARKRAEEALLKAGALQNAIFNSANFSSIATDAKGVIQIFNVGAERMLGYAAEEVLNKVVDDSDINLEVAKRILENQGATVETCSDGLAALEHVRVHHQLLDIVLMDVQMPVLDGNEATRRIRQELNLITLPIVALTAAALVVKRQRALEAGMNDFITKPFDPQALIRKVRRLVESARGEPISMVILEAQSTQSPDSPPKLMPSIDAGIVRQMFGEDLPLFKSLLLRLLQEYADFAVPIRMAPDEPSTHARLMGRTHKLKGSAGMIGATEIARLAGATEKALQRGRAVDVVEPLLARLASALTTLHEETALYLKPNAGLNTTDAGARSGSQADRAQLDELCALLERQDLGALEKFESLSRSLSELLGPLRFDRLREAIENLDFRQGLQLLRQAQLRETPFAPAILAQSHP